MRASSYAPAALLLAFPLLACGAASPHVCSTSVACGSDESCILGKCTAVSAGSPIPSSARRILIEPEALVFLTSDDGPVRDSSLAMGASIGPSGRILVKFPKGDWANDSVIKAYLILDRASGAQAGPDDVTLAVTQITEPWSAAGPVGLSWASPPNASSMSGAEAIIAARSRAPIRIDVTSFANELGKKTAKTWGLRVEASGGGYGIPIATGFGAGLPPRLEIYLQ